MISDQVIGASFVTARMQHTIPDWPRLESRRHQGAVFQS